MSEEFLLYQAPDGSSRIQVRPEGRALRLTQQQLADLCESTSQNMIQHIRAIYAESELIEAATCKPRLHVQDEAGRQVRRSLKHCNLNVMGQRCGTLFNQHVIGDRLRPSLAVQSKPARRG